MKHFIYHFTNVYSRTTVLANQIHWKSNKREKNNLILDFWCKSSLARAENRQTQPHTTPQVFSLKRRFRFQCVCSILKIPIKRKKSVTPQRGESLAFINTSVNVDYYFSYITYIVVITDTEGTTVITNWVPTSFTREKSPASVVECVPKAKFDCIPLLSHLIKVLVPVFVCYDKLNTIAHVLLESSDKKNTLFVFKSRAIGDIIFASCFS